MNLHLLTLILAALLKVSTATVELIDTSGCGKTKGCFLNPSDCNTTTCVSAVTYRLDGEFVELELARKTEGSFPAYVAVGFSKDDLMPDTMVTACVANSADAAPVARLSKNVAYSNTPFDNVPDGMLGIKPSESSANLDGYLVCKLHQLLVPNFQDGLAYSLTSQTFRLFLAVGTAGANNELAQHAGTPDISSGEVNITEFGVSDKKAKDSTRVILRKTHGMLMVISWFLFLTPGLFFARYFRSMWPGQKYCKMKTWFFLHRMINTVGLALMSVGFGLIIGAEKGAWKGPKPNELGSKLTNVQLHALLGLICYIAAQAQPIGIAFRCCVNEKKGLVIRWAHRLLGVIAWSMAAATIWYGADLAPWLQNDGYTPKALVIFFVAMVALKIFEFEGLKVVTQRMGVGGGEFEMEATGESRVTQNGTTVHDGGAETDKEPPKYAIFRIGLMAVLVLSALIVVVGFAVITGKSS